MARCDLFHYRCGWKKRDAKTAADMPAKFPKTGGDERPPQRRSIFMTSSAYFFFFLVPFSSRGYNDTADREENPPQSSRSQRSTVVGIRRQPLITFFLSLSTSQSFSCSPPLGKRKRRTGNGAKLFLHLVISFLFGWVGGGILLSVLAMSATRESQLFSPPLPLTNYSVPQRARTHSVEREQALPRNGEASGVLAGPYSDVGRGPLAPPPLSLSHFTSCIAGEEEEGKRGRDPREERAVPREGRGGGKEARSLSSLFPLPSSRLRGRIFMGNEAAAAAAAGALGRFALSGAKIAICGTFFCDFGT